MAQPQKNNPSKDRKPEKPQKKKEHPEEKPGLHPRNRHRERYHFKELIECCPELAPFVRVNPYGDESVDFSNARAVLLLNRALLRHDYGIDHWDIPPGFLCPPVPGRADYIHYIADLLGSCRHGTVPTGRQIRCLDIGVGANCIYPIIGNREYGWSFVGSDISALAIQSASKIIEANAALKGAVELRLQPDSKDIFRGIIHPDEHFDLTLCNPPFHASSEEARSGTLRKLSNLNHKRVTQAALNFGGRNQELWCEGGEEQFVRNMISQSKLYAKSCFWFSTLISKQTHLKSAYAALQHAQALEVKTIPMAQGNKTSRVVVWTFLSPEQRKKWVDTRWNADL